MMIVRSRSIHTNHLVEFGLTAENLATVVIERIADQPNAPAALGEVKKKQKELQQEGPCQEAEDQIWLQKTKNNLWGKIPQTMRDAGYNVGDRKEVTEKYKQKFINNGITKTGREYQSKPQYFDEMHAVLGDKDKVTPHNLQHSLSSFQDTVFSATPGTSAGNLEEVCNDSSSSLFKSATEQLISGVAKETPSLPSTLTPTSKFSK